MFWLGLGVGLVTTSLLLGLMGGSNAIDEVEGGPSTLEVEQLREAAVGRGYRLVSASEWDAWNEQAQQAESLSDEKQTDEEQEQQNDQTNANTIYIYVPEGFTWQETAKVLEQAKFVEKSEDVMQVMREMGKQKQLQSGLYEIHSDQSVRDIVDKLSKPPK